MPREVYQYLRHVIFWLYTDQHGRAVSNLKGWLLDIIAIPEGYTKETVRRLALVVVRRIFRFGSVCLIHRTTVLGTLWADWNELDRSGYLVCELRTAS